MTQSAVHRMFIDGSYGQIHLRVAGQKSNKPALICMHMISKSGRSFENILPVLASDRLVIAPDFPGYGESSHPPANPHVRIEDYAQSICEVINHFELSAVDLLGYHTGSLVAIELAHSQPARVNKIINISAPVFTEQEARDLEVYFAPIPLDESGERFRVMWKRIMDNRGPGMTLEIAEASMAENLRGGDHYEWGHRAAFKYAKVYAEKITQIDHPIFVMNINDDLFKHTSRVDTLLNNGVRRDYKQWGAGFLDAWTRDVDNEVLEFLNSQ